MPHGPGTTAGTGIYRHRVADRFRPQRGRESGLMEEVMVPGPRQHSCRAASDMGLDAAFVIDVALAAGANVAWRLDLAGDSAFWAPGLDELLGLAGGTEYEVAGRLREAVEPIISAAQDRPPGQDFELERRLPDH